MNDNVIKFLVFFYIYIIYSSYEYSENMILQSYHEKFWIYLTCAGKINRNKLIPTVSIADDLSSVQFCKCVFFVQITSSWIVGMPFSFELILFDSLLTLFY